MVRNEEPRLAVVDCFGVAAITASGWYLATTPEKYLGATADWRTDLYASRGTLLSYKEASS